MNLLCLASETSAPGADEFVPVLVYVVIHSNPPGLLSTMQYVTNFYDKRLRGEEAYYWMQFCAAIAFIKTLRSDTNWTLTSSGVSEEFAAIQNCDVLEAYVSDDFAGQGVNKEFQTILFPLLSTNCCKYSINVLGHGADLVGFWPNTPQLSGTLFYDLQIEGNL